MSRKKWEPLQSTCHFPARPRSASCYQIGGCHSGRGSRASPGERGPNPITKAVRAFTLITGPPGAHGICLHVLSTRPPARALAPLSNHIISATFLRDPLLPRSPQGNRVMNRRTFLISVAALAGGLGDVHPVLAQTDSSRPIRLLVPLAPAERPTHMPD